MTSRKTLLTTVAYCVVVAFCVAAAAVAASTVEEQHRRAFIQTDNQLRYLVDGISLHMHQDLSADSQLPSISISEESTSKYANPVTFYPSELNFKEHPVGMPDVATVIVSNPNLHNVYLLSISGSSVHFHCSFFQDKVIHPGENTTFTVVFLSRHEGPVRNTLYIHTSAGSYKYEVYGVGTPNPYRLRPFLGARVPLNSVYSSVINMYNPHSSTLQVTEMYSSGGDLHLELPTGEREAMRQLWEIQPYETKSVMRASFVARVENNHTVFIRIKTNSSNENYLVLPVEVEVSSAPGIYTTTDALEFGIMYSKDMPRTLALHLLNRGQKPVQITSVSASPSNEALDVVFESVKVPPDTTQPVQVAKITFHPQKALTASQFLGKIVIRSKNNQFKLNVPYVATVLHGFLEYNSSDTEFFVGESWMDGTLQRDLTLTNTFNVSVAIHHIELPEDAQQYFEVQPIESLVLHSKDTKVVGLIKLVNFTSSARLNTYLRFHTNVSQFDVPLLCYNGKLATHLPVADSLSKLDLGTLSLGERRDVVFAVINENPVNVHIKGFGSTLVHSVVEFMGVNNSNVSDILYTSNFTGFSKALVIPYLHFAVFRIGIKAPDEEETFAGKIFVETQYEVLKVPFSFRTAKGSLSVVPSSIIFESTFPGKVASFQLYLQSSFSKPMTVMSVVPLPHDSRFTYKPPKIFPPILQPNARTLVGKLQFDIRSDCQDECYTGFSTDTSGGDQWASSFPLPGDVSLIDVELYEMLQSRWENILSSNKKRVNVSFQIDTSEVRGFRVDGHAMLTWPNLSSKQKVTFPLTQIGNSSVKDIVLENPSSLTVIAQIVPLHYYPTPEAIFNVLEQSGLFAVIDCLACDPNLFELKDTDKLNDHFQTRSKRCPPHSDTIVLELEPRSSSRISVQFTPTDEEEQVSVLLIRNNLTVLETVLLTGTGAYGQLRFGNRISGSTSPLLFELTDKHLRDCQTDDGPQLSQYTLPHFTVRRAFTIRNTGQLPVYVRGFDINSNPCEGYGFRVLNCVGFFLNPNGSKKIDIAFTPDFTLSYVQRVLHVHTSLSGVGATLDFLLVAKTPAHSLARCSSTLPRPVWEAVLYYVAISMMGFLMFCVVVAAYLESDRIYRCSFVPMTLTALPPGESSSVARELGKVFDLKNMSAKLSGKLPSDMRNSFSEGTSSTKSKKNHRPSTADVDGSGNGCKIGLLTQSGRAIGSSRGMDVESLKHGKKKLVKKVQIAKLYSHSSSTSLSSSSSTAAARKTSNVSSGGHGKLWTTISGRKSINSLENSLSSPSLDKDELRRRQSNGPSWTSEKTFIMSSKAKCRNVHTNSDLRNGHAASTVVSRKEEKHRQAERDRDPMMTESSSGDTDNSEREQSSKSKCDHQKRPPIDVTSSTTTTVTTVMTTSKETEIKVSKVIDESEYELSLKPKSKKGRSAEQPKTEEAMSMPTLALDLPYKPKGTASSTKMKDLWQWEKVASQPKVKLHNKQPQTSKTFQQAISDAQKTGATRRGFSSPEWDVPRPTFNTDEAYNEIANQTETFAMRWNRIGKSSPSNTATSRPMSSRIGVPPLSVDCNRSKRLTPVGKIAPEPKRVDPKELGPVGQKPSSFTSAPVPPVSCWNMTGNANAVTSPVLGTPHTPPERTHGFLYAAYQEAAACSSKFDNFAITSALPSNHGDDSFFGSFGDNNSAPSPPRQTHWDNLTHATDPGLFDAKKKQTQFQDTEWLDFGLSKPSSESVWGLDPGSFGVEPNVEQPETNLNYWGSNECDRDGSPWPSTFPWLSTNLDHRMTTASPMLDSTVKTSLEGKSTILSKENPAAHTFDPFSSLQNIWSSPISANKDQGIDGGRSWANPFFRSPTTE